MDAIVKQIGLKNNCTFCGVFRRQALDRGAMMLKVDKICTGHNTDDVAETVLMNVLRGDIARLRRCTAIAQPARVRGWCHAASPSNTPTRRRLSSTPTLRSWTTSPQSASTPPTPTEATPAPS